MTTIEPDGTRSRIPLLAILLLAAVVRWVGLASYALWEDELYTLTDTARLFSDTAGLAADVRPLYFVLQHVAAMVLPDTPLGMRLLPFVFGMVGVWLTWLIGARLIGATAGLVAALLVALAPSHIYASQIGRYVSLLYLLAALFFYTLQRAYETDRPRAYGAALLASLAGVLTHPIFLFPAVGVALACTLVTPEGGLGWRWPSRRGWLYLWGPFLFALALLYGKLALSGTLERATSADARTLVDTLRFLPGVVQALTLTVAAAGALGALLFATGSASGPRRWGMMALLGCASTLLILIVASRAMAFGTMHAAPMHPLVFISAGALVQLGADHMTVGRRTFIMAAVALLIAGVLPATVSHVSDGTRFDYRPVFREIQARDERLPVVTWPIIQQRHYAPRLRGIPLPEDGTTTVLDSVFATGGPFWVVASFRRYGLVYDDRGHRTRWLLDHCQLSSRHERPRLDYQIFRVELYRCGQAP